MPLRPTELLIFGSAKAGTPLMQADQAIGIDLPLKALVFEDKAGKVWLSYNDPRRGRAAARTWPRCRSHRQRDGRRARRCCDNSNKTTLTPSWGGSFKRCGAASPALGTSQVISIRSTRWLCRGAVADPLVQIQMLRPINHFPRRDWPNRSALRIWGSRPRHDR